MPQTCHVQQVLDITIQPLRFVPRGFQKFLPVGLTHARPQTGQAVDGPAHRGQRCAQIVRDGSQQGAAQLLVLAMQAGRFQFVGKRRTAQRLG